MEAKPESLRSRRELSEKSPEIFRSFLQFQVHPSRKPRVASPRGSLHVDFPLFAATTFTISHLRGGASKLLWGLSEISL